MKNVYLYIENQNEGTISKTKFRRDTPYQIESNDSYVEIQKTLSEYDIRFDFLAASKLAPGDVVIISNFVPFFRGRALTNFIRVKNTLLTKKSGFLNIPKLIRNNPKVEFIPFLWESEEGEKKNWYYSSHELFPKIATWNTKLVKQNPTKYYQLNLQAGPLSKYEKPKNFKFVAKDIFISTIANAKPPRSFSSGYRHRLDIINWYVENKIESLQLYGGGWQDYINQLNQEKGRLYQNIYGGTVKNKSSVISNSRFYLCIENCISQDGYVTEKIFDAFKSSTVPIYLGAPNITDLVPSNCFVNLRNFGSNYKKLHEYLRDMTEKEYSAMRKAGEKFMASNSYSPRSVALQIYHLVTS